MREKVLSLQSLQLLQELNILKSELQEYTWKTYGRVNPFNEDLADDWKAKGAKWGTNITVYDSTTILGEITIGDNTWIGPFCSIDGTGNLSIGSHCSISAGTHIQTHDTVKWALSGGKHPYEYRSVTIGNNCFIGVNSVITAGVNIGNHCVIGAGAVVTKSIPDYSIAVGVPAKIVGKVMIEGDHIFFEYFNAATIPV